MIKIATSIDISNATSLAFKLWPSHSFLELEEEIDGFIKSDNTAIFLFYHEEIPIGYSQVSIRYDYVEGSTSTPVGYLEGIFVEEDHRKKGIARALLNSCENWTKDKGCLEFGSDTELTNDMSINFHLRSGFSEAARLVAFIKKI